MKKLTLLFIFISQVCIAQSFDIKDCGIETNPILNECEATYFNEALKYTRNNFDFYDKKVAFAYGNYGKGLITKKDYFNRWGKDYYNKDSNVSNQLFILTEEEKKRSGGYDAIIVSWSKIGLTKKHMEKIIANLNKKSRST